MTGPEDPDATRQDDSAAPPPDARLAAIAAAAGLHQGRIISFSKSGYIQRLPRNYPVFNGHLVDDGGRSLWQGDLDLTEDEDALVDVARAFGESLHVLHEEDASAGANLGSRLARRAVISVSPSGEVRAGGGALPPIERGQDGRLRRAPPSA